MSNITNTPKKNGPILRNLRNFFEHRALWFYLIYDEAAKEGLDLESISRKAIRRCGVYHGSLHAMEQKPGSLPELKKNLFGYVGRQIFEMKIVENNEETLGVDFHYCPLVNAWKKQGCSDELIDTLCDIAMCGDRGIAENYSAVVELPKTIAKGDGVCELRFHKVKADA